MKIAVVGLGKIGLPVAVQYASQGHDVTGCDVDPLVVAAVNDGRVPVGVEGIDGVFEDAHAAGRLRATTDTTFAVAGAEATVLLVPIGAAGGQPDYRHMDAAVADVARGLGPDHLVVFETTMAVGDTRNRYLPVLASSGRTLGQDLFVAFSPERVQSHRVLRDLRAYPKIVGGLDGASGARARRFYESVLDATVVQVRDAETAELTKLAESVYRDVNIALANELARYAHDVGVDITEVIEVANSEPLSHLHQPGAGVGGHCIPVYPYFLLARDPGLALVGTARRLNDSMPAWTLDRVAEAVGGLAGARVLVLGLSYRANLRETSGSVALALIDGIRAAGGHPVVADSYFTAAEISDVGAEVFDPATLTGIDAVVVQALHDEFADFPWGRLRPGTFVLDGRNILDPAAIRAAGLRYCGVGRSLAATDAPVRAGTD